MAISNITPDKVIIPFKNKIIGMMLIYSDIFKKEKRVIEEYINIENIIKYVGKKQLKENITMKEIGKDMINHFNSTMKKGERIRKFISVYVRESGEYYIKK